MSTLQTIVIGTSLTGASDGVVRTGVAIARAACSRRGARC